MNTMPRQWQVDHVRSLADIHKGTVIAARRAFGKWFASLGEWNVVGTFTYRRDDHSARASGSALTFISTIKALRDTRRFIGAVSKSLDRPLPAIVVIEPHRDGSAHLHGLFEIKSLTPADDQVIRDIWHARHGFAQLERPRSVDRASAYAAKWAARDDTELFISREVRGMANSFLGETTEQVPEAEEELHG